MTAIVLLPGMDGTGSFLTEFIASLPTGLEPVVVAYPTDEPLGYSELEALVAKKLPQHPFLLVGESFSGPIAIALAASAPIGLRGLVLIASFAKKPITVPTFAACLPLWRLPIRVAAAMLLGQWSSEEWRARLSTAMARVLPSAWRARLHAVLSVDVISRLRSVSVPVLYLRGKRDRVIPLSAWRQIKEALPSARLVELDGPHFLLQVKPLECAGHVIGFAKEVGFAL